MGDHSQARLDLVEDPFGKVKRMVRQMLDKLIDQSSKDADQHSFCETEMTKSVESLYSKSNDIQKLSDRLLFMNADIDRLATELAQTKKELHDANQVLAAAAEMRNKEKLRSTQAVNDYSGAQSLLTDAIGILKKFYSKQAIEADTAETTGSKEVYGERNREGLGHGIVAILEIAIQDFSELEDDAQQEESKSEQMFKDMTLETRVRIAELDKNIEFKTRKKVKTEGEQARAQADLKSYQKEVSAIEDYLAQLKAQCIAKVDPYDVRK